MLAIQTILAVRYGLFLAYFFYVALPGAILFVLYITVFKPKWLEEERHDWDRLKAYGFIRTEHFESTAVKHEQKEAGSHLWIDLKPKLSIENYSTDGELTDSERRSALRAVVYQIESAGYLFKGGSGSDLQGVTRIEFRCLEKTIGVWKGIWVAYGRHKRWETNVYLAGEGIPEE